MWETDDRKRRSAHSFERSGGGLLVGLISTDRVLERDVNEWATALDLILRRYASKTEQSELWLFVPHGVYLLSF